MPILSSHSENLCFFHSLGKCLFSSCFFKTVFPTRCQNHTIWHLPYNSRVLRLNFLISSVSPCAKSHDFSFPSKLAGFQAPETQKFYPACGKSSKFERIFPELTTFFPFPVLGFGNLNSQLLGCGCSISLLPSKGKDHADLRVSKIANQ
jgi:hypothetical protein